MNDSFKIFSGTEEQFDKLRKQKFLELNANNMNKLEEFEDAEWEDLEEDAMREPKQIAEPEKIIQNASWSPEMDEVVNPHNYPSSKT